MFYHLLERISAAGRNTSGPFQKKICQGDTFYTSTNCNNFNLLLTPASNVFLFAKIGTPVFFIFYVTY